MTETLNYRNLLTELKGIKAGLDYSLKGLNRYGTGGNAKLVVFPMNCNELQFVVSKIKGKYPYVVIGGGSNLLISDMGFDGVVISTKNVNATDIKSNLLTAECGVKLSDVISEMKDNSFGGLEFAIGIPATVGGAVAMNAGCFGKSISEIVKYVVSDKGVYTKDECGFGYRTSRFLNGEVILKVCFSLEPTEEDIIDDRIKAYKSFRKNPKGKSCGSVFRNEGYFAGKIIDEVGLKGYKIGKAKISNEHANFIIAEDGATSSDVYNLIKYVKQKVYEKKQIELFEEIIYVGEF
ncbi:MAG: UDP-N-acetylmuramate dehydrogenase [Clostridia bacterium]|nr:UDP-N-acetylmuramate dehydrogenase [Clostridia bacterium]